MLQEQWAFNLELRQQHSRIIPSVFTHLDGEPIVSIRKIWASATKKANHAGLLLHDLRRSGIMTFSQKGIDQQTGMLLSGHKTASVYRRYNIPTKEVLLRAAAKLEGTISGTDEKSAENTERVNRSLTDRSGG